MYCGRRRSLRHSAVFICLDPSLISSYSIALLFSLLFPSNSPSAGRKLLLVAAKLVSPAARFPRGLLPLLAAPLPKNLAAQCFREPFLTSSSLRGLSFAENPASKRFPTFLFLEVARSQLPASSSSSPQSSFRPPLASLAACFPYLRLLFPKTLLRNVFGSPFHIVVAPRPQLYRNSYSIALPYSLLFPSNSPSVGRRLLRCRCPCCGGESPKCPPFRASPKSGRRPFPSPSSRSAP